jgi:hypothetical protein
MPIEEHKEGDMSEMPSDMKQGDAPVVAPPRKPASRGSKIAFSVGVIIWLGLCALIPAITPILTAWNPSVQVGLAFNLAITGGALLAANFVAIYPAFFRRELRSNPIVTLLWVLGILGAAFFDVACLWGVVRLVLHGPTLY